MRISVRDNLKLYNVMRDLDLPVVEVRNLRKSEIKKLIVGLVEAGESDLADKVTRYYKGELLTR